MYSRFSLARGRSELHLIVTLRYYVPYYTEKEVTCVGVA